MDEWLAKIYKTGGAEDIEKTAQAQFLQKLAEEDSVDLSGLSDEELQALADQVGEGEAGSEYEGQAQQELLQKEAQAKFEEADFLGRIMAHSFTNEMAKIASQRNGVVKVAARKKVALPKTGKMVKKASAFEKLAEERAAEMLSAVGIDPATGQEAQSQQPQGQMPQSPTGRIQPAGGVQTMQRQQPQQGMPAQQAGQQPGQPQGQQGSDQQVTLQQVQAEQQRRLEAQAAQPGGQGMQGQQDMQGQQGGQEEQFENAVNSRALEMLESLGYPADQILQALSQQGPGGQQQQAGVQR